MVAQAHETRQRPVAVVTFLTVGGLYRLGMAELVNCAMDMDEMLLAVGQGAVGIDGRSSVAYDIDGLVDDAAALGVAAVDLFVTKQAGSSC